MLCMKDMNRKWLFVFVIIRINLPAAAILGPAPSHPADNYTVICDPKNTTFSFYRPYLASLVTFPLDGVYLVDPNNAYVKNPRCRFYEYSDHFVFVTNTTTDNDCYIGVTTPPNKIVESFRVQLFTTPPMSAVVSFDSSYAFNFQCEYNSEYNVSSPAIIPFIRNIGVVNNISNNVMLTNVQIIFYMDGTYTTVRNPNGPGYAVGTRVYFRVSLTAATNFFLNVTDCSVVNVADGIPIMFLLVDGCLNTSSTTSPVKMRADDQNVNVNFLAFEVFPNNLPGDEYFRIECDVGICDKNIESCSDKTCARRRRSVSAIDDGTTFDGGSPDLVISKPFHVITGCTLGCQQICVHEEGGGYACACLEGFQLNDDRKTCRGQLDSGVKLEVNENANKGNSGSLEEGESTGQSVDALPSALYYSSIALIAVLTLLLIVIIVKKCRRHKHYDVQDEEMH